jgi:hypothetical protein
VLGAGPAVCAISQPPVRSNDVKAKALLLISIR